MPSFVHPWLLAGLALAAIPVALHLLMKQKPKPLEFPALRLLKVKKQSNTRRLKLRHWMLLLFRILAVCAMAAGLARPSMQSTRFAIDQQAPVDAAVVVDNSVRMDYKHQNETRLEAAKKLALWLLGEFPAGSLVAVNTTSVPANMAGRTAADETPVSASKFGYELPAAKQRVERITSSAAVRPLAEVVQQALEKLKKSERPRKELYILTDLTRITWKENDFARVREQLKETEGVGLYVIDLGVDQPQNFSLGDIRLSNQVLPRNSPLEISVDALRVGPKVTRTIDLYLQDADGKRVKRGGQTVELGPNELQEVVFRTEGFPTGVQQGVVEVIGDDGLIHDNTRYFTVDVRPAWKILVAGPWPRAKGPYLHPSDYLIEALSPTEERQQGSARFDCSYIPLTDLVHENLAPYSAISILDPSPQPPPVWTHLRDYVQRGGRVAVFLGRSALTRPASFNQPEAQSLLAGELEFAGRAANELYLAPNNFSHPMLSRFRSFETNPWTYYPVFRYWKLKGRLDNVQPIISFNNKLPALLERNLGKGRVLTMTTPITDPPSQDDAWNLLLSQQPAAWPYVALMNELHLYLVGEAEGRFNYETGQTALLPLDPQESRRQFAVRPPDEPEYRERLEPGARLLTVC